MPFPWEEPTDDNPISQAQRASQTELALAGHAEMPAGATVLPTGISGTTPGAFPPGLAAPQITEPGLPDYLTNPGKYVTAPAGAITLSGDEPGIEPDPGDGNTPVPPPAPQPDPQEDPEQEPQPEPYDPPPAPEPDLTLAESHKLKCPKCDAVQTAKNKTCKDCGHDLSDARKAKFAKLDASQEPEDESHDAVIYNTQGLNLAVASDGLLWKVACKTGILALSPGPGQTDLEQPLELTPELFDDMVLSAEEKAFPYITVPETHANGSLENTGYVKAWEVLDRDTLLADSRLPEAHRDIIEADPEDTRYLLAGIEFKLPEVKRRAELGAIPDTSIGVKFNYRNKRTGKLFKAAWEHLALTPMPWVDGLVPFGLSQRDGGFIDAEAEGLMSKYDGVYLPMPQLNAGVQARVTQDGSRYDYDIEDINPTQIREDAMRALLVIDEDSKLDLPMGVCIQRYDGYWVVSSDYDKIAGIRQEQGEALDLAMETLRSKYNDERARRISHQSEYATPSPPSIPAPWPGDGDEDDSEATGLNYSVQDIEGFDAAKYELALAAERERLNLAINFDPQAHPRDLLGQFKSVLSSAAKGSTVELPDGTSVKKRNDGSYSVRPAGPAQRGVDYGSVTDVDKAAKAALEHSTSAGPKGKIETSPPAAGRRFSSENSNGIEAAEVADHIDRMNVGDSFTIEDAEGGEDWLVTKDKDDEWTVDDSSGRPYVAGLRDEVLEHLGLDPDLAKEQTELSAAEYNALRDVKFMSSYVNPDAVKTLLARGLLRNDNLDKDLILTEEGKKALQARRNLSQDAPVAEREDLSRPDTSASLPADSEQIPRQTGDAENTMPRTVEEILAAQQAELEASQQRIKDLESQLSLSQGTISSQGEQLHIDAVNKRVAALQGAGYPPALCLAVKTVMEADKGRITGAPEDGLNLSISRPTKAEDGTEGVEELKLSTATDVVEFLLSAVPTGDGTEAAKLAGLHAGLGELNASAHEDRNSDKAKIDAVEAHEREAHPERFKDNGKGERL